MSGEVGICSWGVAIPRRRLSNAATQEAWGRLGIPGTRSIGGQDEDAVTLGAQAVLQAVKDSALAGEFDARTIDALIFASTSAPLVEKSCAALIADVVDLRDDVFCLDLNTSTRSGTNALATAAEFIRAGTMRYVLVIAADTVAARPGDPDEFLSGHAGVALLVGPAKAAPVTIFNHLHCRLSHADVWRTPQSLYPQHGDVRFSRVHAYQPSMQSVLERELKSTGWRPAEIRYMVVYSPDVKSGVGLLKKNGFDVKTQYCDRLSAKAGLTGTAHTLLMLVGAMENSGPGDRLLTLDYGDGAGAFALQVHDDVRSAVFKEAVSQRYDISYNHYLNLRRLHAGSEVNDNGFTSEAMAQRNRGLWRALVAKCCVSCETVMTLPLPTCPRCRKPTEFAPFPLRRKGTIFAVTHEHYYPTPEAPLGMATVELDRGGRLTLQVADENVPVRIGDRVELVLRRLHDAGNLPNYFWKCRPVEITQGGGS